MDERRVVQVIARGAAHDKTWLGSGYLAGRGMVLTAAHVVHQAQAVMVRRVLGPGQLAQAPAQLVWLDPSGHTDLAVLRIAADEQHAAAFPVDLPPVKFGRIVGPADCEAVGFPLFKLRSPGPGPDVAGRGVYRDTHHARGITTPLSDRYGGTLEVTVEPPREDPDPHVSPWEGMSGAAVFADNMFIGIVCEHHRREGTNRITARRVESWYDLAPGAAATLRSLVELPELDALARVGDAAGSDGYWQGCPYLGLMPYRAQDAQVFYGRDEMIARLKRRIVVDQGKDGGLLVVTGPSGVGKSSLINAGLVPALVSGPQSHTRLCRVMTPTATPLQELAVVLAEVVGRPVRTLLDVLTLNPKRAGEMAAEALAHRAGPQDSHLEPDQPRLVLVVDQFEELFTRAPADQAAVQARTAFVSALHALSMPQPQQSGVAPGVVIVAVRGDFVDRLLEFEPLAAAYESGPFVVRPMTSAELRLAISGPATEAGLNLESALVEEILREVRERPDVQTLGTGVLPLVSQVMARTWQQREGTWLTMRAYRRAGGLTDAVNRDAAEVFEQLDAPLQAVARVVFLSLTLVTADGRLARRRVERAELYHAAAGAQALVDWVVEAFAARRLLVLEHSRVEISHEILLQAWSTLQGWLDGDRVDHAIYSQLVTDAESWAQRGNDSSYLYSGSRLQQVAAVQARRGLDAQRYPPPPVTVTRFINRSYAADHARTTRRRRVIAGLLTLAMAFGAAAFGAAVAAKRARHDEAVLRTKNAAIQAASDTALSRQLAAESQTLDASDPYGARQLAVAAWTVSPTAQAGQALASLLNEQRGAIVTPDGRVQSAAINTDGTLVATASDTGVVRLWNPQTHRQVGTAMQAGGIRYTAQVAFNASGTVLAESSGSGITLWNPATQQQINSFKASDNFGSLTLAFAPRGNILAVGGAFGTVQLWDVTTGKGIGVIVASPDSSPIFGLAYNASGTLLAAGDYDGHVTLWDPATGHQIGSTIMTTAARGSYTNVQSVAFNPSGTLLATADGDGTVKLWNSSTHQQIGSAIATIGNNATTGVAFNPDGTILATAGNDGTVRLWNPATMRQNGTTIDAGTLNHSAVTALFFTPSGTAMVTASGDGTVKFWDPESQQPFGTGVSVGPESMTVAGVAFNNDGTEFATADYSGNVKLWNPVKQQQIGNTITVDSGGRPIICVAFNPSGDMLATADSDGTVKLWNSKTQKQIGSTITVTPDGSGVTGVAFKPRGYTALQVNGTPTPSTEDLLATADGDGNLKLWNVATQQQVGNAMSASATAPGTPGNALFGLAFNPEGTLIATAGQDGTVRLWDVASQRQNGKTITATQIDEPVYSVAFNLNSTELATADSDGTVNLWDPATQNQIGTIAVSTRHNIVHAVAYSPSGTVLATAGSDGAVRLWNARTKQQIGSTINVVPVAGNAVEGLAFSRDGAMLASADDDGRATLLNVPMELEPFPYLCRQFGLPPASLWSKYVGSSVTEPAKC